MPTVSLPGFEDITRDSQITFRTLLESLAMPGVSKEIRVNLQAPEGVTLACAAACLTLLDLETTVWLQPGLPKQLKDWLQFHTGCLFTQNAKEATFAIVHDAHDVDLEQFCWGSDRTPEASTTLLVQSNAAHSDEAITLTGPGLLHPQKVSLTLPRSFWQQWQQNQATYPKGIDAFVFSEASVVGLPRTTHAEIGE